LWPIGEPTVIPREMRGAQVPEDFKVVPRFRGGTLVEPLNQIEIPVVEDLVSDDRGANGDIASVASSRVFKHGVVEGLHAETQARDTVLLQEPQLVFAVRCADGQWTALDAHLGLSADGVMVSDCAENVIEGHRPQDEWRASANVNRRQRRPRRRELRCPESQLALDGVEIPRNLTTSDLRAGALVGVVIHHVMTECASRLTERDVHVEAGLTAASD